MSGRGGHGLMPCHGIFLASWTNCMRSLRSDVVDAPGPVPLPLPPPSPLCLLPYPAEPANALEVLVGLCIVSTFVGAQKKEGCLLSFQQNT